MKTTPRSAKTAAAPALLYGPYAPPACEVGSSLTCAAAGRVTVAGMTSAPVPWPYRNTGGTAKSLILCGTLERAVRSEAAQAVAYHWGVDRSKVRDWRRLLGVTRVTQGTKEVLRTLAPEKLSRTARASGGKTSGILQGGRRARKPLHFRAPGPRGPLTLVARRPGHGVDGKGVLAKLGWEGTSVPEADYARLVRACLGAGITLIVHPERE